LASGWASIISINTRASIRAASPSSRTTREAIRAFRFEHIIRKDRPVREILFADYTFLNKDLAAFYGVKREIKAAEQPELMEGANAFHRGGMLRLGAVLTATSAPLRTSPVKRGDWVLRRVLGTTVPPPPADAGSIPTDDKLFEGLSMKARLENTSARRANATPLRCARLRWHYDPPARYADGSD
jgi:hypothetical protein